MARAHLYRTITDAAGNLRPGATVRVFYPGSDIEITESLYVNDLDDNVRSNPFTSTDGIIDFYLAQPLRVRLGVRFPGEAERFFNDVDVMLPFDEGAPVHGHPYAPILHTHSQYTETGHEHPAAGVSLMPTGTVEATELQSAVLELNADTRAHAEATNPHTQYLTKERFYFQALVSGTIVVDDHVFKPGIRMPLTTVVTRFGVLLEEAPTGPTTIIARRFAGGVDTGDSMSVIVGAGQFEASVTGTVNTALGDVWRFDVTTVSGTPADMLVYLDCE